MMFGSKLNISVVKSDQIEFVLGRIIRKLDQPAGVGGWVGG